MGFLRILVRAVAALVVLGVAVYFGARLHDGPLAMIPGGPLVAGDSYRFVAVGSVPGTRLSGDVSSIRVNAISVFDGAQTTFNTDQVTVSTNAVINITKSVSAPNGASPSGPYTYTLTYTNSGNATAMTPEEMVR